MNTNPDGGRAIRIAGMRHAAFAAAFPGSVVGRRQRGRLWRFLAGIKETYDVR